MTTDSHSPLDAALDLFVFAPVGLAITAAEELPKMAAKGRSRVTTQLTMARVVGQFAVAKGRSMIESRIEQATPPARPTRPAPAGGPDLSYDELLGKESTNGSNGSGRPPLRPVPDAPAGASDAPAGAPDAPAGAPDAPAGAPDAPAGASGGPAPTDGEPNAGVTDADMPGGAPASAGLTGVSLPGSDTTESNGAVSASVAGDLRPVAAGSQPDPSSLAIPGYDSLSASQVVQRLAGLSRDELAAVGAYEQAHRGRRTILNRVNQLQGQ